MDNIYRNELMARMDLFDSRIIALSGRVDTIENSDECNSCAYYNRYKSINYILFFTILFAVIFAIIIGYHAFFVSGDYNACYVIETQHSHNTVNVKYHLYMEDYWFYFIDSKVGVFDTFEESFDTAYEIGCTVNTPYMIDRPNRTIIPHSEGPMVDYIENMEPFIVYD